MTWPWWIVVISTVYFFLFKKINYVKEEKKTYCRLIKMCHIMDLVNYEVPYERWVMCWCYWNTFFRHCVWACYLQLYHHQPTISSGNVQEVTGWISWPWWSFRLGSLSHKVQLLVYIWFINWYMIILFQVMVYMDLDMCSLNLQVVIDTVLLE